MAAGPTIGGRSWRRHDGRANRGPSGQCGPHRDRLRRHPRRRQGRPRPPGSPQARPPLHPAAPGRHPARRASTTRPTWPGADWVIEAVVEDLDVKRDLLGADRAAPAGPRHRLVEHVRAFRWRRSAAGRSAAFRRRWLGTHFFNPPRYLRLVELIPTAGHRPRHRCRRCRTFLDHRLGKGVVIARDTPGVHRQSHRHLRRAAGARGRRRRRVHDRGDRRGDRPGHRPAEERDVPDDGHRRPRHPRARRRRPRRTSGGPAGRAAVPRARRSSREDGRPRAARREDRRRLLQAGRRRRRARDPDARAREPARSLRITASTAPRRSRTCRPSRRRGDGRRDPASGSARLFLGRRPRRLSCCVARSVRRSPTPPASRRRSPTRSTTSIARCGGATAGSSGRSRRWTRSAWTRRDAFGWTRRRARSDAPMPGGDSEPAHCRRSMRARWC